MDVGKIERADVLKVLNQKVEVDGATATFWLAHPVTASRVRGRLSKVLALGKARELRSGPNPATWDDDMEIELSKRPFPEFHPTLGYPRTPEFFQTLRNGKHVDKPKEAPREWWAGKMPALVLAFTIASCLRVGEVTSMTVGNLDRKNRIATVKVKRKGKQKKRIPYHTLTLTPLMSKILDEAEALRGDSGLDPKAFVFPGERSKSRMRQFVVGRLSKQILPDNPTLTVHGFRSAFRDFAGNKLSFDSEVCEFCLAHVLAGTEAAYRREDAPEKRRKLMEIWNHYLLTGVIKANVVELAA
jgi:integrase